MPLVFPPAPVDGEVYGNYQWSATDNVWNLVPSLVQARYVVSPTAPSSPSAGDAWFNSEDGVTYIYYQDVNGSQWVQTGDPQLGFLNLNAMTDVVLTSPTNGQALKYNGSNWVNAADATGKILQVVQTVKNDTFSAAGVNNVKYEVTGFSATITPSSTSSKIYAVMNLHATTQAGAYVEAYLERNNVNIGGNASSPFNIAGHMASQADTFALASVNFNYLDSPSSTSALTYRVLIGQRASASTTTIWVNRTAQGGTLASSFLTLMEVAA